MLAVALAETATATSRTCGCRVSDGGRRLAGTFAVARASQGGRCARVVVWWWSAVQWLVAQARVLAAASRRWWWWCRKRGIIVAVNSNRNQFSLLQNNCSPTAFVSLPVSRSLLVPVASSLSLIRCCKMIARAPLPSRSAAPCSGPYDLHRASLAPLGIHDKLPASEAFGAGTKTDLDPNSQSGLHDYGNILLQADGISHRPGETKQLSVNRAIRGICVSACLARNVEMRIPYATLADCSSCCKCWRWPVK
jgi:hypothetical protein